MAQNVSRDIACTNGHELIYAILTALLAGGWTVVAWSDGAARTGSSAGFNAASDLAAVDAWVIVNHTATNRKLTFQRKANSNTWSLWYTFPGAALTVNGVTPGTIPDAHATLTQVVRSNIQLYPTVAPTNTKLHVVVDDANCKAVAFWRRTPFPGGAACGYFVIEAFAANLSWAADPDPCVAGLAFDNGNNAPASFFSPAHGAWYRKGLGGETYDLSHLLETVFAACGSGTPLPGAVDTEFALRWGRSISGFGFPIGVSTLLKGLNPFQSPTTGVDAGATLNRAAFGAVTCANDGTALDP